MKDTFFSSAAIITLFILISCHKDNDNITIQGKWFEKSTQIRQYNNDSLVDDSTYIFSTTSYEFTNDGVAIYRDEDGDTLHYTYTYDDNTKKLVTQKDGDAFEYDVTKLTSNEMAWHEEDSTPGGGSGTYKLVYDINFQR